jgi:predicted RNA-binding Zn-ribbon protein involved in translation (DUF1610 family)
MMKRAKWPEGPLTQTEYDKFRSLRKRAMAPLIAAFAFAIVMVVTQKVFYLEPPMVVLFLFIVPITIWGLIQILKYKCPRCGTMPMMTRTSLGGGEVEVGSYVALRPKKCHECGVLFECPQKVSGQFDVADEGS